MPAGCPLDLLGATLEPVSPCATNGQGQNRTADTRIFSPLLYQLSYLAGSKKTSSATTSSTSGGDKASLTPPLNSGTNSGTHSHAVRAGSSTFAISFAFPPLSRYIAYRRVIAAVAWRIPTCTRASDAPASTSHWA